MGKYLTRVQTSLLMSAMKEDKVAGRCLDVGCGSGRFSLAALEKGLEVVALDRETLPLTKIRGRGLGICPVRADAVALPFKDSSFETVMAMEMADFLPSLDTFFAECFRVLSEHGLLCLTLSNRNSWKRYLHRMLSPNRIFYRFSPGDVIEELTKSGFEVLRTSGFNWQPLARNSNSRLVGIFEWLENFLRLPQIVNGSPWFFVAARKQ